MHRRVVASDGVAHLRDRTRAHRERENHRTGERRRTSQHERDRAA